MVESDPQRTKPRVEYVADVELLADGWHKSSHVRALNLSEGGLLVQTERELGLGTRLLCSLPLPGGRRYLRGRVVRRQKMTAPKVGVGISFEGLEPSDREVLKRFVAGARDDSRLVKVRFEGMSESLRSRARVTKDGLRLVTALPFLRVSSEVDVSIPAGQSQVSARGIVEDVHLLRDTPDGVPRLAVDVGLADTATAELARPSPPAVPVTLSRPAAVERANTPAPQTPENVVEALVFKRPGPPAANPDKRPRPSRAKDGLIVLPVAAVTMAGVLGVWAMIQHLGLRKVDNRVTTIEARLSGLDEQASTMDGHIEALADAQQKSAAHLLTAIEKVRQAAQSQQAGNPDRDGPTSRRVWPLGAPTPLDANAPQPGLTATGNHALVSVPITGSAEGMVHYSLAGPHRGLEVKVPRARSVLSPGYYWMRRDGIRVVWIRQEGEGLAVRILFENDPRAEQELFELTGNGETLAIKVRVRVG